MWTSAFSVAPNWGMFDVSQNSLFGWFIYMGLKVTFLYSQSPSWRLHLNIQTCPNLTPPPQKKLLVVENLRTPLYPPHPSTTSTTSPLRSAPFPKAHSHGLQDRGGWMERWSQRAILWRQEWRGEATKPRGSLGRVIHQPVGSRWWPVQGGSDLPLKSKELPIYPKWLYSHVWKGDIYISQGPLFVVSMLVLWGVGAFCWGGFLALGAFYPQIQVLLYCIYDFFHTTL